MGEVWMCDKIRTTKNTFGVCILQHKQCVEDELYYLVHIWSGPDWSVTIAYFDKFAYNFLSYSTQSHLPSAIELSHFHEIYYVVSYSMTLYHCHMVQPCVGQTGYKDNQSTPLFYRANKRFLKCQ